MPPNPGHARARRARGRLGRPLPARHPEHRRPPPPGGQPPRRRDPRQPLRDPLQRLRPPALRRRRAHDPARRPRLRACAARGPSAACCGRTSSGSARCWTLSTCSASRPSSRPRAAAVRLPRRRHLGRSSTPRRASSCRRAPPGPRPGSSTPSPRRTRAPSTTSSEGRERQGAARRSSSGPEAPAEGRRRDGTGRGYNPAALPNMRGAVSIRGLPRPSAAWWRSTTASTSRSGRASS